MNKTNERLAGIRQRLHVAWLEAPNQRAYAILHLAFEEIVPDMASFTAVWIALMLRDEAHAADCRDDREFALILGREAQALDDVWDNV